MTPETILNATIGVLEQRGRHFGDFEYAGKVCVLGGVAIAAGADPAHWRSLQTTPLDGLIPSDLAMIGAAIHLADVVAPTSAEPGLEDLVALIGHWHDGERFPHDVRPTNAEVFDALTKAAHNAGQAAEQAQLAGGAA